MFKFIEKIKCFFKTHSRPEICESHDDKAIDFSELNVSFEYKSIKGNTLFELERLAGLTIISLNNKSPFINQLQTASQETRNCVFLLIYSIVSIEQNSSDYEREVIEQLRSRLGKNLSSLSMYSKD